MKAKNWDQKYIDVSCASDDQQQNKIPIQRVLNYAPTHIPREAFLRLLATFFTISYVFPSQSFHPILKHVIGKYLKPYPNLANSCSTNKPNYQQQMVSNIMLIANYNYYFF